MAITRPFGWQFGIGISLPTGLQLKPIYRLINQTYTDSDDHATVMDLIRTFEKLRLA